MTKIVNEYEMTPDRYFIHTAEVINKEDIPYDVYIAEVKIERYPMD